MDEFSTPPVTKCKMFYLINLLPYAAGVQLRTSDEETLEKNSINQNHFSSRFFMTSAYQLALSDIYCGMA
jgi:hypothetical protein